jgi:hypothetical protein
MRATVSPIRFIRYVLFAVILIFGAQAMELQAQATLSIQGILKKSNGVAVDDGNYTITFKLYTVVAGGTAIWSETQNDVEVSSGIYSAVLGSSTVLNVPFNQLYYLGVTIGSTELTPRILLTSAPYALSLIGVTNKFPSSGKVQADSIQVSGSVLARGGAPGLNGANKHGYAFTGNGGDKDSGLFSTGDGKVSLYSNNTEVLAVTPASVQVSQDLTVQGAVTSDGVNITNNNSLSFNGIKDWRLIDVDDFETGNEGWGCFTEYNTTTNAGSERVVRGSPINTSFVLRPTTNAGNAMRKQLDLTGIPHDYVKVKFTVYFFNTVDPGESVYAALSSVATPNFSTGAGDAIIGWNDIRSGNEVFHFWGSADQGGWTRRGEMEIKNAENQIWFILDSTMSEATTNENYGISNIEIWVK